MIDVETAHYIKGLHNLMSAHFDLGNYQKFRETIHCFENFSQTPIVQYKPFISATDPPAIYLNQETMSQYREKMKPFYYDPSKYATYLEQLGIKYPTVEKK
jgi:hypothetical protein